MDAECAASPIVIGNVDSNYRIIPPGRSFKVASLNVNNLLAHFDESRILLAENPLDILAINETNNEVHVKGYEIVRRDLLSDGDGGGGICLYIRTSINYSIRTDLHMQNLENLCIEIRKGRTAPFLVVTWYRPPDTRVDIFNDFELLVGKLVATGGGDSNC